MATDRELLQMALEALEEMARHFSFSRLGESRLADTTARGKAHKAAEALRARLANEFNPDWDQIEALRESLREHMAEIHKLRAALAQPEPEPYGYIVRRNWKTPTFIEADNVQDAGLPYNNPNYEPVFKAPPQREWQGLTTDELNLLWVDHHGDECLSDGRILSYERAIEAKLKQKNGGSHD